MTVYYSGAASESTNTQKIDSLATDGLAGTSNSLAYRVHEVEKHFHSYESWFETAATPSGETHIADRIGSGSGGFSIDAGNNTWGSWVQILGSSDTPARAGMVKFDPHRIVISNAERNSTYFVQLAFGDVAADAFTAGDFTEFVFTPVSGPNDEGPIDFSSSRQDIGTKVWVRCMCPSQNTGTLTFELGIHEYAG